MAKKALGETPVAPQRERKADVKQGDVYDGMRKAEPEKQKKRVTFISDRIWEAVRDRARAERIPVARLIRRALIRELGLKGIDEGA
jgi:hypothetical protein